MLFEGKAIKLIELDDGFLELNFDLENESINKFSRLVVNELDQVLSTLESKTEARGLLLSSAKDVFFVGADITEFGSFFNEGSDAIKTYISANNKNFSRLEDLPYPTLVAINGFALGGGMEISLACDFRLMSENAKIGLPETKLGIIPGWGGTVRLPRLSGLDVAVEWIASGAEKSPGDALKAGVVDGVVPLDKLRDSALGMLTQAAEGKLAYKSRRDQKKAPLKHNDIEGLLAFESSKAFIKAKAGRNYPAPVTAIKVMQNAAKLGRDEALKLETDAFAELAQSSVAMSLIGLFLSDQAISKKAKLLAKKASQPITRTAVLGAGIMGGGIAYQSAYKKIPILMKDIAQDGLDLGMSEAAKLLSSRVEKGRMSASTMAEVLNRITPTLSYDAVNDVDLIVEAVVENPKVKHAVLSEIEDNVDPDTVLCSNTSTISIDFLAKPLKRPEQFCGMHFFNPVYKMPLVEVIRGSKTNEETIGAVVAYATAMGKKPIVVKDCPGFLVNRVLFPYFAGFTYLLRDGGDFRKIDSIMERWGWPMGPAYLLDVVGIDTGVHARSVMAEGFPDRMVEDYKSATDIMYENKRLGQKNNLGFYEYAPDKKGKIQKNESEAALELLSNEYGELKAYDDEEIIARMMVPMATEIARCLEEGIVDSVEEADMALIYGLGFPPFRGGIFRWLDQIGLDAFIKMAEPLSSLGKLYEPTSGMLEKAKSGTKYYSMTAEA